MLAGSEAELCATLIRFELSESGNDGSHWAFSSYWRFAEWRVTLSLAVEHLVLLYAEVCDDVFRVLCRLICFDILMTRGPF